MPLSWEDLTKELYPTEDSPQQVVTTAPAVNQVLEAFQKAKADPSDKNMITALTEVAKMAPKADLQTVTNQQDFPVEKLNQISQLTPELARGAATKVPLGHDVNTGAPLSDTDLANTLKGFQQMQGVREREGLPSGQDLNAMAFMDNLLNLGSGRGSAMITPDVENSFAPSDMFKGTLQTLFGPEDTVAF